MARARKRTLIATRIALQPLAVSRLARSSRSPQTARTSVIFAPATTQLSRSLYHREDESTACRA